MLLNLQSEICCAKIYINCNGFFKDKIKKEEFYQVLLYFILLLYFAPVLKFCKKENLYSNKQREWEGGVDNERKSH